MIFEEIVAETCEKLNLTSETARSRVARAVNNRYKRLTSSIGLITSRYVQVSEEATEDERTITFTGIEKINSVLDRTDAANEIILVQVTLDEMHSLPLRSQPPRNYAVTRMGASSVEIMVDCLPEDPVFTLYADGMSTVTTLSANDSPEFPESFHDILIWGAMADEYRKMEKPSLMMDAEQNYERRLSDLRMFIAKNAYLDIVQGKYSSRGLPWMNGLRQQWP